MKKLITLIFCACAMNFVVQAQTTRMILVEEFTNASCGPCAAYNPGFNAILNANPNNVVAVKYQVNWPGPDPMNAHNPTEVANMVSYYNVTGVPRAILDGNVWSGNAGSFTQTLINNRAPVPSPFSMTLDHVFNPTYSAITVSGTITATQAHTTPTNLRVAVIERHIYFCTPAGSNGETHFQGVMKKMLPNSSGTTLPSSWTAGQTESFSFTWNLANVYDKTQLAVVAWVYNPSTKEVHQADYSAPQGMPVDARITCAGIGGIPHVVCANVINPTVEIKNNGLNPLTSLTISYSLNGAGPVNLPWTGNLAAGATTIVNLPALNVTPGSHLLQVSVSMPNGTTDYNTTYDQASRNFLVSGATGTAIPLSQDFVPVTFPPAGWLVINPDGGPTWSRSGAGLNNIGSAKMDFYNSGPGNIDELWIEGQNFSGASAVQMDFDLAYARYNASYYDTLQIQVSIDCGNTWTTVFQKANLVLATAPDQTSAFTPSQPSQWRHETVNLNAFAGQPLVYVKFKGISGWGNNLYIDNINFADPLSVNQNAFSSGISLFPSPTEGKFNLNISLEKPSEIRVEVYNITGQQVASFHEGKTSEAMLNYDLSHLTSGLYTIKISANDQVAVKPLHIIK